MTVKSSRSPNVLVGFLPFIRPLTHSFHCYIKCLYLLLRTLARLNMNTHSFCSRTPLSRARFLTRTPISIWCVPCQSMTEGYRTTGELSQVPMAEAPDLVVRRLPD
jgi:hypothetical protein